MYFEPEMGWAFADFSNENFRFASMKVNKFSTHAIDRLINLITLPQFYNDSWLKRQQCTIVKSHHCHWNRRKLKIWTITYPSFCELISLCMYKKLFFRFMALTFGTRLAISARTYCSLLVSARVTLLAWNSSSLLMFLSSYFQSLTSFSLMSGHEYPPGVWFLISSCWAPSYWAAYWATISDSICSDFTFLSLVSTWEP